MKPFSNEDKWFRREILEHMSPKSCDDCGNILGYEHNDTDGATIILCTLCYSNEMDKIKRE